MLGTLFPLFQPVIRRVDAETAHDLAVLALEKLPLPACAVDEPRLAVSAFGLDFPNPVGIAAGFDKNARVPDALLRLGFGFAELGGVTKHPQPGNAKPRVFRLTGDRAVINRYGLNSDGMEVVATRLTRRERRGIVGTNLGANKDSSDRIGDYVDLVRRLGPLADFLTLNISSPNTPGLRDLQGADFLDELLARTLEARMQAAPATRILLKIAPDLDDIELDDIVRIARQRGIDGMIVSNTTVARPSGLRETILAREAGGLSGAPLFRPATIMLAKTYQRVEGAFPLIGVGGISRGEDAVAKIAAGASLVQLYSALIYRGPALIGEIKRAMLSALIRNNLGGLADLVGKDANAWAAERA